MDWLWVSYIVHYAACYFLLTQILHFLYIFILHGGLVFIFEIWSRNIFLVVFHLLWKHKKQVKTMLFY